VGTSPILGAVFSVLNCFGHLALEASLRSGGRTPWLVSEYSSFTSRPGLFQRAFLAGGAAFVLYTMAQRNLSRV